MFSFVGETVLDPFAGSGTTALAAKHLGRNSIGYEINSDFQNVINEKIQEQQYSIFDEDYKLEFCSNYDKSFSVDTLPYLFSDPHRMDKKVDVKKLQYGSKIDGTDGKREDLYSVKRIISPEKIELNNGLTVRLLGIKENPKYREQAISFLQEKFQKRKIFLKYDSLKYDPENVLLCYVYLDNKTFINNHMIRTGFVDVDMELDYSCKIKFLNSVPI